MATQIATRTTTGSSTVSSKTFTSPHRYGCGPSELDPMARLAGHEAAASGGATGTANSPSRARAEATSRCGRNRASAELG